MNTHANSTHVLIIGGGLGGTALAQALRKKGISYDLFERDESGDARSQGWALALHQWLIKDLTSATMDDLPRLETVGVGHEFNIPGEGAIFDATNMTEYVRFGNGHGPDFIRADRSKLRAWLQTNINIHWDKRFTHFEETANGVTVYFDDGTSYRGSILVGADGVNSRVRDQLLSDLNKSPEPVPLGIVVGEVEATEEQLKRWMKLANTFFIGHAGIRRMFVGLKGVAADGKSAKYYWFFFWNDENAVKDDFWTMKASQHELHQFVQDNLVGVHSNFAEIFQAAPVESILCPPIRMRDMMPAELPNGRITLLGDAIHPMVPFRGEGGNMAMEDGISLARCLQSENGISVEEMLKAYEAEMIPRTTKSVQASRAASAPPK